MMKIVPASRLVTESSLEPPRELPSIDRRRAIAPRGRAVAGGASITAKRESSERAASMRRSSRPINYSLRFGWAGGVSDAVIPGHAKHVPGISRFPDVQLHI